MAVYDRIPITINEAKERCKELIGELQPGQWIHVEFKRDYTLCEVWYSRSGWDESKDHEIIFHKNRTVLIDGKPPSP